MNSVTLTTVRLRLALTFFLLQLFSFPVLAQNPILTAHLAPIIDVDINGFYDYLPRNYDKDTNEKYPLLLFFHGYGDSGGLLPDLLTLSNVLNAGTPKLLNNGTFPDSVSVKGKWYKFIVIAPQLKGTLFSNDQRSLVKPATIDALIDYATRTYRVDPTRIYLAGLSMGGGVATDYVASSPAAAKRIAAIAVAAAASDVSESGAENIVTANVPIVATHNKVDDIIPVGRTVSMIAKINNNIQKLKNRGQNAVDPKSIYWETAGEGNFLGDDKHNAWSRTFVDIKPGSSKGGNLADTMGVSVYEWMLQYARTAEGALPLVWESFDLKEKNSALEITWATSKEVRTKLFAVEKSSDGLQWTQIGSVTASNSTDASHQYSFIDAQYSHTLTYYRIKQIDLDEAFTYSVIKSVGLSAIANGKAYPNPFTDRISLNIPTSPASRNLTLKLFNSTGDLLRLEQFKVDGGTNYMYTLQGLQNLSSGNYVVTVENDRQKVLLRELLIHK